MGEWESGRVGVWDRKACQEFQRSFQPAQNPIPLLKRARVCLPAPHRPDRRHLCLQLAAFRKGSNNDLAKLLGSGFEAVSTRQRVALQAFGRPRST